MPWRKNLAWVASNIQVNGAAWPYCPRTILQRQLERATRQGYVVNIGVEQEFMLLKRDEQGGYAPWDALDTLGKPCYDLRALHRNLDLLTTLIKYVQELGWDPYANDHEDANCQFEINYRYADALTTADRHTFFKWMVKSVAEQQGLLATFMPKPFAAPHRQRRALPPEPVGPRQRDRTCSSTSRMRTASRSWPTGSWAASCTTPGPSPP